MYRRCLSMLSALTLTLATQAGAGGHPDLSGTYDVATLTPVERPEQYGDRLTLTDEETAKIFREVEARTSRAYAASDPDRAAPPEGGDGSTRFAGNVGGYNSFWLDRGTSPIRVNGRWRTSILTDPNNGRYPPMTEEGNKRKRWREMILHTNTGDAWWIREGLDPAPYDDLELRPIDERCLLGSGPVAGPPILPFSYNNLKRVVQTDDYVMILAEMIHDARIIRLNAEHDPPDVRKWLGDSVGHWEGDTLVVDTTNFKHTPALTYASRDLHVVERFTRIDENTLLYQFTVDDPTIWTAPWSGEYVWPATDSRVYEYACHEANYSFMGIMRGARVMEAETLGRADQQ